MDDLRRCTSSIGDMNLSSQVQIVLQDAGYRTWLDAIEAGTAICFEDDSAIGFVFIFETPRTLIERWRNIENVLLVRNAGLLRKAGDKAWNVYSVFLTAAHADEVEQRAI